jgi:hypothetical protein
MSIHKTDVERFHTDGLVTLSPGFPYTLLDTANEAIDALNDADFIPEGQGDSFGWYMGSILQPELLRLVYDPFFEQVSKTILRAEAVELAFVSLRVTKARPNAHSEFEPEHVDFKCGTFSAYCTPVAMPSSFFVWLTDVQADNCPLYYRPGSHLQMMRYIDDRPDDNYEIKQAPPDLEYADPVPVFAERGQASLLSGTVVHGGSVTPGHRERRLLVVEFKAKGTKFPLYAQVEERTMKYLQELKDHLPSDRLHLLPEQAM